MPHLFLPSIAFALLAPSHPSLRPQRAFALSRAASPSCVSSLEPTAAADPAPATEYFQPLQTGDVLESTLEHRLVCGGAGLLVLALCVKAALVAPPLAHAYDALGYPLCALAGFEFADFGSGVYHWAMDNYGNAATPVWGKQIEAFQGHHERPWTITHRQTCNNLHQPALATIPPLLGFLLFVRSAHALVFGVVAMSFIMCAQELHKWAHYSKPDAPAVAIALQGAGLAVGRRAHLTHHRSPFETNYCIVSGHCNKLLDGSGFFTALERLIHALNGVQPRSWTNERFDFGDAANLRLRRSR